MKNVIIIIVIIIISFILPVSAFAQSATLALSPASGTFNQGCNFSLNITLNTNGAQTDGTDAIVLYDTSRFSATSISQGTLYPDYPGNSIDDNAGKVIVSGLASVDKAYSGAGTLATVNFLVKQTAQAGVAQITFNFTPGSTTDSIVAERSTTSNILGSVTNGSYTVGTGSCSSQTSTTGSTAGGALLTGSGQGSSTGSAQLKSLDDFTGGKSTGSEQLTYTIAILGSILTIFGILGLAIL